MTDEKKLSEDTANTEEAQTQDTPTKKEKKGEKLKEEIAKLEGELAALNDKYLRMAAEYDNFRRRSREEKEATYENALADTVATLLPIIDNLERAAMYDDGDKVKEGLVMIAKSVTAAFSSLGIEEVGKVGETFDPNVHSAVMHVEDDEHSEGEIVEVFQKGYKKGNHIIRFAAVKTAN